MFITSHNFPQIPPFEGGGGRGLRGSQSRNMTTRGVSPEHPDNVWPRYRTTAPFNTQQQQDRTVGSRTTRTIIYGETLSNLIYKLQHLPASAPSTLNLLSTGQKFPAKSLEFRIRIQNWKKLPLSHLTMQWNFNG